MADENALFKEIDEAKLAAANAEGERLIIIDGTKF